MVAHSDPMEMRTGVPEVFQPGVSTIKVRPALRWLTAGRACCSYIDPMYPGSIQSPSARRAAPILTPSVLQWTGVSPWMDLVQRALTWERASLTCTSISTTALRSRMPLTAEALSGDDQRKPQSWRITHAVTWRATAWACVTICWYTPRSTALPRVSKVAKEAMKGHCTLRAGITRSYGEAATWLAAKIIEQETEQHPDRPQSR